MTMAPSVSYSITARLEVASHGRAVSEITRAVEQAGGVVTAPLSDHILHGGAVGYGWLNAGWGTGAFASALYAPWAIKTLRSRPTVALSMAMLAASMFLAPFSRWLAIAVAIYAVMGSARGLAGIAITSSIMERVPSNFMGRVQNTFYFVGTGLQVVLALTV